MDSSKKGQTNEKRKYKTSEEVSLSYTASTSETWERETKPEGVKFEEEGEGTNP